MIGIYYIKCIVNKKVYIGSSENIEGRFKQHLAKLNNNKHHNSYLQNSYNKYGEESFKLGVITICKPEELLKFEQFYIDKNKHLFNIVTKDVERPSIDEVTIDKITRRINEMYKSGELSKVNKGSLKKGNIPWNKGKKYKSTDHLKVKKLKKGNRENYIRTRREKEPELEVYNTEGKLLGKWRCSKDIEEQSKDPDFILINEMKLRNPFGRNGYSPFELKTFNINKSSRANLPYKGLYFKQIPRPQ